MNMEEIYSDDALVEQIRLGDEKAAEELIRRYYTSVLCYCKRQCFNLEKAEDLTQETFLKLFKNLSGYKEKGNLWHIYIQHSGRASIFMDDEYHFTRADLSGADLP